MLELVRLTIEAAHQAHCGKKIPDMVQTIFEINQPKCLYYQPGKINLPKLNKC